MRAIVFLLLILVSSFQFLKGCSTGSTPVESITEIAAAVISGASAVASGSTQTKLEKRQSPFPELIGVAFAENPCTTYGIGTLCTSNSVTFTYDNCSFGTATPRWTGGSTLTFSGGAICGSTPLPLTANGHILQRTFVGTGTSMTKRVHAGVTIYVETNASSGYLNPVSGGFVYNASASTHTITISGVRVYSPNRFDYTFSTTSALNVTNPGSARSILGQLQAQDNLNSKSGTILTSTTLVYTTGNCVPSSGVLTFTDASSGGVETFTISSTSLAVLRSPDGSQRALTPQYCF